MSEYLKTQLPDVLTVRSIVTVFHTIMQNRILSGEKHSFPELLYVARDISMFWWTIFYMSWTRDRSFSMRLLHFTAQMSPIRQPWIS